MCGQGEDSVERGTDPSVVMMVRALTSSCIIVGGPNWPPIFSHLTGV